MSDMQKIIPRLALCFIIFMLKDVFVDKYMTTSTVQANSESHSHNSNGQAIINENKYAQPSEVEDEFDFEAPSDSDGNVSYEVFEEDEEDEYISPKSAAKVGRDVHVKFQICTSWGYKNAFNQYQQMLAARYGPSVRVTLEQYPVPPFKQQLAQIIITFGYMTEDQPMPEFLAKMKENKIYSCLMIFFISNALEGMLISTGAFEIFVNEELVASKLKTGQVENPRTIINKLDLILGKPPGGDNFDGRFQ